MDYRKKLADMVAERNRRIVAMAGQDIPHDEIAKVYGISRVRVTQIVNKAKQAGGAS